MVDDDTPLNHPWRILSETNLNEHTEAIKTGRNELTYISWAWAWGYLKNLYPEAKMHKHWFDHDGMSLPYAKDSEGYAFVKVTVKIRDEEITEILPVLNHMNKAIKHPDSFAVNTAIQRCFAKCIALHGLGLYVYANEDLPQLTEETAQTMATKVMGAYESAKTEEDLRVVAKKHAKELVVLDKHFPHIRKQVTALGKNIQTKLQKQNNKSKPKAA